MTTLPELYASIHRIHSLDLATEDDLRLLIRTFPVIDNHAHNLLREEHAHGNPDYPFECIVSEAQGHALLDHGQTSLAHIRGIKQLAELFKCPATLQDVKAARYDLVHRDYPSLIQRCFEGTHAIMMDDGLSPEVVHPGKWHRQFVPRVSRIARIESIAAELLEHLALSAGFLKPGLDGTWDKSQSEIFLTRFNTMFRNQIKTLAQDPNVRGFKSVVCYRSGLDVSLESRNLFRPHQSLTESTLLVVFHDFLHKAIRDNQYRVGEKAINDFLVLAVCDVLDKMVASEGESLPFQFHTGLGDTDLNLVKANPAYMQPLIEAFPNVDFVLLHSGYPYTREAGYLAANYVNAWLDIGEVFPILSRIGEESVLRQALELTPTSKILWSTDGHFYPETYYLANKQFRLVLEKLLVEYVQNKDISIQQAINMAVDIMFWNSNMLYRLEEENRFPQLAAACGRSYAGSARPPTSARPESRVSRASTIVPMTPTAGLSGPAATALTHRHLASTAKRSSVVETSTPDTVILEAFLQANPTVKYIWAQFVDFTGFTRLRMMPVAQCRRHLTTGKYMGVTSALPRLLQNDQGGEGATAVGEFKVQFDLSSLSMNNVIESPSATLQGYWMTDSGAFPTEHYYACPRWALRKHLLTLKQHFDITMLMGFEIEVVFVQPVSNAVKSDFESFEPINQAHSWSSMTYQDLDMLPMIEEIVESLAAVDIHVPQFHAENAAGQWEFPLPAFEPVKAIDVLYKARDIVRMVARKYGYKATLYPRPYPMNCGTASHAHFSINGPDDTVEQHQDGFLAGILEHLGSILAFTLPLEESYERILAGIWAGGEWITWGTQNRETPLRKCGPGHWELKTIDGIGNVYLSMAAVVAAGLYGLENGLKLKQTDCRWDASTLTDQQRADAGITTRLPKSLAVSLDNLDKNTVLRECMGSELIDDYIAVKRAEIKFLNCMDEKKRRTWLIARY